MYHVLLADDEPWALMTLKSMIDWGDYGFVVSAEATDGEQALERIGRMNPDLIVSDIRMPGLNGLELLAAIREQKSQAEVLLVSGYSDFEYARKALQLGCAGYLLKPVEEAELTQYLRKIKETLDERTMGEQGVVSAEEGYHSEKLLVRNMMDYINLHFSEALTLQVLSREFSLSESHISTMIKKRTGKGFHEHLTEIRIRQAQDYLKTTNDSIEVIAERVGYPDYFYFMKLYKKVTGISPAAFRKQL